MSGVARAIIITQVKKVVNASPGLDSLPLLHYNGNSPRKDIPMRPCVLSRIALGFVLCLLPIHAQPLLSAPGQREGKTEAASLAGPTRADTVDDYLRTEMAVRHLPGLSVAVLRDGKMVKSAGYGLADIAAKTPATPATAYGLGSCTKPITALAVLTLVETGKVGLDQPITAYLRGLPAAWKGITVRQLLTHTSGLPNYRLRLDLNHLANYAAPDSVRKLVENAPLNFVPGTRYEYINTNYHLLAEIIEKVSGQSYRRFIQSRLFRPAGLTGEAAPSATGYLLQGGANVRNTLRFPAAINTGDSGLVLTAPGLAAVCAALDDGRLLRPDTVRETETPGTLSDGSRTIYGLGWVVGGWNGHRLIGHSGAEPGYSSTIYRLPDDKLTIVLLSNTYDATPLTDSMALGIAKLYLPARGQASP